MASLYLPNLNADIIDTGVAQGDTAYIWRTGAFMLLVSVIQGTCAIGGTWCAAKAAMSMGRDLRSQLFRRVGDFSEQEVSHFGAGSSSPAPPTTSSRSRPWSSWAAPCW